MTFTHITQFNTIRNLIGGCTVHQLVNNLSVFCRSKHKTAKLPILRQINQICLLLLLFFNVQVNILFEPAGLSPSHPRSIVATFPPLSHSSYMFRTSHPPRHDQNNTQN